METSPGELIRIISIVGTPIGVMCWHLYRKLEAKIEVQEKKMTEIEKAVIEIRTEFKFTSRDIKEIKEMLTTLAQKQQ